MAHEHIQRCAQDAERNLRQVSVSKFIAQTLAKRNTIKQRSLNHAQENVMLESIVFREQWKLQQGPCQDV